MGSDVGSSRARQTGNKPEHALFLVRIPASTSDSIRPNNLSQYELAHHSLDANDCGAMQIDADRDASSFERHAGRSDRTEDRHMAEFTQSHRHGQWRVRAYLGGRAMADGA